MDNLNLNEAQMQGVEHVYGPLLILAGAGSGKTRVITHRIVNLVQNYGIFPSKILAVTFTNRAAREMHERIVKILGPVGNSVSLGTFHKTCLRLLRKHIDRLGYKTSFTIYDDDDQIQVVKQAMKELDLSRERFAPRALLAHISRFKNDMLEPHQVEVDDYNMFRQAARRVYEIYQHKLKESQALDFDDLLNFTVRLLKENADICYEYNDRWPFIMVDEYQDTNKAQYEMLRLLTKKQQNICVVGDDDQSIYRWRGADLRNILSFETDFPNCETVKLEQNYRSTQIILDAAHDLISKNLQRKEKKLWTEREYGERIIFFTGETERREAQYVAEEIIKVKSKNNLKNQDIAIFYRTNAQSRAIEEQMRLAGLPYAMVGGVRFYERKEIKDVLAYLRLLVNEMDDVSLKRVINVPARGIGDRTVENIEMHSRGHSISFWQSLNELARQGHQVSAAVAKKLNSFIELIELLKKDCQSMNIFDVFQNIIEKSGYKKALEEEDSDEARDRLENLAEMANEIYEFQRDLQSEATVERFIEEVSLMADIDTYEETPDRVTLMTVHSAKGLEFPVVFITGMEEQLFPHSRSVDSEEEIEEERRLAYVGITRAMQQLYFTMARARMVNGVSRATRQSRFLSDIDPERIDNRSLPAWDEIEVAPAKWNAKPWDKRGIQAGGAELSFGGTSKKDSITLHPEEGFTDSDISFDGGYEEPVYDADSGAIVSAIRKGSKVYHPSFGVGMVISISGQGENAKCSVSFPGIPIKKLVAKFLQPV